MKFYDLNLRGQNYDNDLALVKEANKFGWDYLNLNYSPENFEKALEYKDDLIDELSSIDFNQTYRSKKTNFEHAELSMGINVLNANSNEIRKIINKYRNKSDYISCLGGDLKVNRSVCENHRIDVLSRPYYKRRDSGMNHVLAKEAKRNNVAIELCFKDILNNRLKYRANVISSFKEILMFHRKFKFPLILTTDSKSIYDVRSTRDIVSFFKSIGFSNEEIYNGFYYYPKQIIDFNKERKSMIVKGVKIIDSDDFTVFGKVLHLLGAGTDNLAIVKDGAGAANTNAVPDLNTGKTHAAKHGCKSVLLRVIDYGSFNAVNV